MTSQPEGDGSFTFQITQTDNCEGPCFSDTVVVNTSGGSGSSGPIGVPTPSDPTNYTVTELVPGGWKLLTSSCSSSDDTDNGATVTNVEMNSGEQQDCNFTNRRLIPPPAPAKPIPVFGGLGLLLLSGFLGLIGIRFRKNMH